MNRTRFLWLVALGIAACGRCWAVSTNALTKADYAFFAVVPERNIFNSGRVAPRDQPLHPVEVAATPPTDTLALVGTMTYEKGTFAFFTGSDPDYQKVLPRDGVVAGFRVAAIAPDAVTLAVSNRTVVVRVGTQLQRDPVSGGWTASLYDATQATQRVEQAAAPAVPQSSSAPEEKPDDDVLKKLMQKREQELQ